MSKWYEDNMTGRFSDVQSDDVRRDTMLTFDVRWKNTGRNTFLTDACMKYRIYICPEDTKNWNLAVDKLKGEYAGKIRVTYFDKEGDEIPVESQCEFDELIKYCHDENQVPELMIERVGGDELRSTDDTSENRGNDDSNDSVPMGRSVRQVEPSPDPIVMEPNEPNDGKTQSEDADDKAPQWFTNYMRTMKEEMVNEVSEKVTKIVLDALNDDRKCRCNSVPPTTLLHPQASPSDVHRLMDSEANRTSSNSLDDTKKKTVDNVSRSASLRRQYIRTEKKRIKSMKRRGLSSPVRVDTTTQLPTSNRRRSENNQPTTNARRSSDESEQPHGEQSHLIREMKNLCAINETAIREKIDETLNREKPCNPSGDAKILFEMDLLNDVDEKNVSTTDDDELAMGCSYRSLIRTDFTHEKPMEDYVTVSDSDNISIISDASNDSDLKRQKHRFEMLIDDFERTNANPIGVIIAKELHNQRESTHDDNENARDSSSFELLSEPPSSPPILSIHMDEDHFAPGEDTPVKIHESNDYNINDDSMDTDKRGHHCKIDKSSYAIDAHGKIYQCNITDDDDDCPEIILDKRTDGAYSFVGDSLPINTKEKNSEKTILKNESGIHGKRTFVDDASMVVNDEPSVVSEERSNERPNVAQSQKFDKNLSNDTREFTTSFSTSHSFSQSATTSLSNEKSGDNVKPRMTESRGSHIFTDKNASKGLGDTKKTSPKKTSQKKKSDSSKNKNGKDSNSERMGSNRNWRFYDNRETESENDDSENDGTDNFEVFATNRASGLDDLMFNGVNPMQILPGPFVSGAVYVAASALTTARHVYDRLNLKAKPTFRSPEFGRR